MPHVQRMLLGFAIVAWSFGVVLADESDIQGSTEAGVNSTFVNASHEHALDNETEHYDENEFDQGDVPKEDSDYVSDHDALDEESEHYDENEFDHDDVPKEDYDYGSDHDALDEESEQYNETDYDHGNVPREDYDYGSDHGKFDGDEYDDDHEELPRGSGHEEYDRDYHKDLDSEEYDSERGSSGEWHSERADRHSEHEEFGKDGEHKSRGGKGKQSEEGMGSLAHRSKEGEGHMKSNGKHGERKHNGKRCGNAGAHHSGTQGRQLRGPKGEHENIECEEDGSEMWGLGLGTVVGVASAVMFVLCLCTIVAVVFCCRRSPKQSAVEAAPSAIVIGTCLESNPAKV